MAIFTAGPLIGDVYGSIGGITFSAAQGMAVVKIKPIPRKRIIPSRTIIHNRFSRLVYRWKTSLSDADRTAWNDAAALFIQSRHGIGYVISGINLFCGWGILMEACGIDPQNAPTLFDGRLGSLDVAWAWDGVSSKIKGTFDARAGTIRHLFWCTNGNRPGATVRKTPYPNFQFVLGGAVQVLLVSDYLPSPGTLFIHWISIDTRGSMSSISETYTGYP